MPIDPNIALSLKPVQLANPLEQYMQVQQIQASQNQNRLADLIYGEKQRDADQNVLLNNLYKRAVGADGSLDRNKLYSGVAGAGLGSKLPSIQKSFADADKTLADVNHVKAQTKESETKTAGMADDQREKKRQKAIVDIAAFKSPQEALASLAAHEQAGDLTPEAAASVRATIPQNPADFPKWQIGMLQRIMSANDIVQANETARHNSAVEQNSAGQLAVSKGQLKVAQDREKREATAPRGQVVQSDAGTLIVDPRTGTSKAVTGPDGQPVGPKLKDIPASVNTAMIANSQSLATLDRTIALLEGKNRDGQQGDAAATGLKGYLPQQLLNKVDPKGIDARAGVADIGSLKLHDRSGAAVTASESPRLMPFIPTATDSNETALKKLKRLRLEAQNEATALAETYSKDAGYRTSPVAARNAGQGDTSGVPDDIAALLKKHGGK